MKRLSAILGSALFLVVAPGTVAGLAPWWISRWRMQPPFFGIVAVRVLGILFIAAGLPVLIDSFARFALQGAGTPAPAFPPQHLVVTGLYRYVRNPMYVAVFCLVLGQALVLGNVSLLTYAAIVWLAFHLFVCLYEEPQLRRQFGGEYAAFCAHVRRWLPRFTPWAPPDAAPQKSTERR